VGFNVDVWLMLLDDGEETPTFPGVVVFFPKGANMLLILTDSRHYDCPASDRAVLLG